VSDGREAGTSQPARRCTAGQLSQHQQRIVDDQDGRLGARRRIAAAASSALGDGGADGLARAFAKHVESATASAASRARASLGRHPDRRTSDRPAPQLQDQESKSISMKGIIATIHT